MFETTCYVALFISRNKDNKGVKDFKERRESILFQEISELEEQFVKFVKAGKANEFSRLYITVNPRSIERIYKELICRLVKMDGQLYSALSDLNHLVTRIAMKPEMSADVKWLLDIDNADEGIEQKIEAMVTDLVPIHIAYNTKNGKHIITEHGFDSRQLLNDYGDFVTIKRDGMRYVSGMYNSAEC